MTFYCFLSIAYLLSFVEGLMPFRSKKKKDPRYLCFGKTVSHTDSNDAERLGRPNSAVLSKHQKSPTRFGRL